MFVEYVKKSQLEYANKLVHMYNFGNRGRGDGNTKEQLVGILGQTVLADLLNLERPQGSGFDGGVDFIINNKRIDVKTMTRTTDMRDYYVHNFIGYQEKYEVDYYIFASYNRLNAKITFCGYVDKEAFFERASFYKKGARRYRSDGSCFISKAPLYEIKQESLKALNSVEDIYSLLK